MESINVSSQLLGATGASARRERLSPSRSQRVALPAPNTGPGAPEQTPLKTSWRIRRAQNKEVRGAAAGEDGGPASPHPANRKINRRGKEHRGKSGPCKNHTERLPRQDLLRASHLHVKDAERAHRACLALTGPPWRAQGVLGARGASLARGASCEQSSEMRSFGSAQCKTA